MDWVSRQAKREIECSIHSSWWQSFRLAEEANHRAEASPRSSYLRMIGSACSFFHSRPLSTCCRLCLPIHPGLRPRSPLSSTHSPLCNSKRLDYPSPLLF